jgi:hypothetical protein
MNESSYARFPSTAEMLGVKSWCGAVASLVVLLWQPTGHAQTIEFLPESNTYIKLDSDVRFSFQAKLTRENGNPTQGEIGPGIDFYWRPLKNLISNRVDASKTRFILLSFGYRYMPAADAPTTHRILMVATPRLPLKSKLVASDRNRGELNFASGDLTWRYRNRLQLEREITIRTYKPTPYTNVEVYYDTRYRKWSSTAIEAGCQFPIKAHSEIDLYYEHQNNTGKAPNQQVNGIGLVLNLHF